MIPRLWDRLMVWLSERIITQRFVTKMWREAFPDHDGEGSK